MKEGYRLASYALYDSGETVLGALIFSTLYPLYITQHVDVKTYSALYGFAFFASFLLALWLGKLADRRGKRKFFFVLFSLNVPLLCLFLFLSFYSPLLNFALYLFLAIVHQQALVFYNSLLKSFNARGLASGVGVASGYVASAIALILFAPLLELPSAFLWVGLLFFLTALPSALTLKEPDERDTPSLRELLKNKRFLLTLASMLLLMELAHTLIAMMGVYLKKVYSLSEQDIYRTIGFSAIGGVLGGLIFGWLTDRYSAQKLFPAGFALWSFFLIILYFATEEIILPVGFLAGMCLAHLWTTSRVLLIEKFSGGYLALRFSFYSLSERIASSVGLFFWSFFLFITGEDYRLSALLMLVFPVVGVVLYYLSDRGFQVDRL